MSRRLRRAIPYASRESRLHLPASSAAMRHGKPRGWKPAAEEVATPPLFKAVIAQPGLSADVTWHEQHREVSVG